MGDDENKLGVYHNDNDGTDDNSGKEYATFYLTNYLIKQLTEGN